MKCHVPTVISDITREKEVQIQFLSNCNHTLIVERVAGVWVEGKNIISLAAQLIRFRSVMIVLIALIGMLGDREPSPFDTKPLTLMTNSGDELACKRLSAV